MNLMIIDCITTIWIFRNKFFKEILKSSLKFNRKYCIGKSACKKISLRKKLFFKCVRIYVPINKKDLGLSPRFFC